MRLKRSEFELLKDVVKKHTTELLLIQCNKELEQYWLEMVKLYTYDNEIIYIVRNISGEDIIIVHNLREFDKRFDWYKQWIKDGDIFIVEECDCNWCKDNTVDEYDDSYTSYCWWTQWIVWTKWNEGDKWDRWPRWPKWESYKETKKVLKPNQKK